MKQIIQPFFICKNRNQKTGVPGFLFCKIFTLIIVCVLFSVNKTSAQETPDSNLVDKYLLDFVVPDMPAFKALDIDQSKVLRPSDVKKFAAMLSPFYSNGKGVIPQNFALEFAPWKIASSNWTLQDYNTSAIKRFLYRSSFSVGSVSDTSEFSNKLGIGYRVSFLSKDADILRAAEIRNNIFAGRFSMGNVMVAFVQLTNHWVNNIVQPDIADRPAYYQNHRDEFNEFLGSIEEQLQSTPDPVLQGLFDAFINALRIDNPDRKYSNEELKDIIQVMGADIDSYIEDYKIRNWNASRLDVGVAWVGQSSSGGLSSVEFGRFSTWLTGALKVHKGGQLLLGGNLTLPRSEGDISRIQWSMSLRYFAGTRDYRGFIETQYLFNRFELDEKSLLLNLGAEFRLGNSFWVVVGAGLDNYLGLEKPIQKLVSNIDLRYGLNKKK
ncbi:MAG: hypothetical protein ACXWV5_13425 [Flavitalea sp.]